MVNTFYPNRHWQLFVYLQQNIALLALIGQFNFRMEKNNLQCLTIGGVNRGIFIKELIMAFAQTLMVFILIVSFGVLAAVFTFWVNSGKLVQDESKNTSTLKDTNTLLDFARWETTTLLLR